MSYDPLENARFAVEHDPVRMLIESTRDESLRRLWKAMTVSRDVETCRALLRGESVPVERCHAEWIERLGMQVEQ